MKNVSIPTGAAVFSATVLFFVILLAACLLPAGVSAAVTCTLAQRNTINPVTGLPYCMKAALLKANASANPYYTNLLPQRVFADATEELDTSLNISVEETSLIWEQGIEAVQNGDYDIFVANIWVLRRRVRKIDFSAPFLLETLGLLYQKKDSSTRSMFSFFEPFALSLWVCVLATFFVGTIVLAASELAHPSSIAPEDGSESTSPIARRDNLLFTIERSFFHVISAPFGTMEHQPVSFQGKIIQWIIGFFFMIVMATYTANLASALTVTQAETGYTKEQLLKEPILVGPGDTAPFLTALGGKVVQGGFADLGPQGFANHPSVKSICLAENSLRSVSNVHCQTEWLRLDIPIDSALVFRQHPTVTTFKRKVDENILRLKETGVLDRWAQAGLPAEQCAKAGDLVSSAMPVDSMVGVFIIAAAVSMLMLLLSAIRFTIEKIQGKKANSEGENGAPEEKGAGTDDGAAAGEEDRLQSSARSRKVEVYKESDNQQRHDDDGGEGGQQQTKNMEPTSLNSSGKPEDK